MHAFDWQSERLMIISWRKKKGGLMIVIASLFNFKGLFFCPAVKSWAATTVAG